MHTTVSLRSETVWALEKLAKRKKKSKNDIIVEMLRKEVCEGKVFLVSGQCV